MLSIGPNSKRRSREATILIGAFIDGMDWHLTENMVRGRLKVSH
jgi:hypothetical protein